jgi:putative transposase
LRRKYGGLDVSEARRLKELEEQNRRPKKLVADHSVDEETLQDVLSRRW